MLLPEPWQFYRCKENPGWLIGFRSLAIHRDSQGPRLQLNVIWPSFEFWRVDTTDWPVEESSPKLGEITNNVSRRIGPKPVHNHHFRNAKWFAASSAQYKQVWVELPCRRCSQIWVQPNQDRVIKISRCLVCVRPCDKEGLRCVQCNETQNLGADAKQ